MAKETRCDVLVVGAGPAGGVCAAKLAKNGFKVICIDAGKFPGSMHTEKIDITENKGIGELVSELKLSVLAKTNKSIWYSPNDKFTFVSKVHDLFFLRGKSKKSLDYSIMKAMKRNKVNLFFSTRIHQLNKTGNKISSVIVESKEKRFIIKPKIVVAATGSDNYFMEMLGVSESNKTEILGFGALVSGLRMEDKTTSIFFDANYAPGGYFFAGKVSKKFGMCMLVVNKALIKRPIKELYKEFIKENQELYGIMLGSKTIKQNGGERTISKTSVRVIGNIAFAGDAARTMSPVFAYGVNPAMRSGAMLAEEIKSIGANKEALNSYAKKIDKEFGTETSIINLRKTYDKLSNADFNFLVETANYLNEKQHLDSLIDSDDYKIRHLITAVLRRPIKSVGLGLKLL